MAVRKENLEQSQTVPVEKRSRITIDISPELRRRIKMAALQHDCSISEYVGQMLEQAVPKEASLTQHERRPLTRDFLEKVYQVRERIIQESKGQLFEDSAELIRQQREERTRQLMGEL